MSGVDARLLAWSVAEGVVPFLMYLAVLLLGLALLGQVRR